MVTIIAPRHQWVLVGTSQPFSKEGIDVKFACIIRNSIFKYITTFTGMQPAGIKFTQYISGQKSAFSPRWKNYCVGSKNDLHLLELSQRPLSPCKVWWRSNYTSTEGAKYVFFCLSRLGLPASGGQWGHSLNKYCVMVYGSVLM